MLAEVKPENLEPGDIIVAVNTEDGCCGHLETIVTVTRSPYNQEALRDS